MRHAYLILAHNEPEILRILLSMLDDARNDVFLHIDRRATALRRSLSQYVMTKGRLHVISTPVAVYWGHTSQIEAELACLHAAHDQGVFDYYHLLSGADLPIKSTDAIDMFFTEHKGKEFVGYWNSPAHLRDAERKVRYYYFLNRYKRNCSPFAHALAMPVRNVLVALQKLAHVKRRRPYELRKGPQWFSITHDFCGYLLEHADEIRHTFRHTLCPDEIFMQVMLWNSPYRSQIFCTDDADRGSMRYIDWERGKPYVWQASDVDELLDSPYLFARKFSSAHIQAAEALRQKLLQRT